MNAESPKSLSPNVSDFVMYELRAVVVLSAKLDLLASINVPPTRSKTPPTFPKMMAGRNEFVALWL